MASGPGKAYRQGITLIEAVKKRGDEAAAEEWFISRRWPDGVRCPFCESRAVSAVKNRKPMPFRRRSCPKRFSVKTNTLMRDSKLPLSKWALALYLYSTNLKGVSSVKLRRDLGVAQKTARHLANRVREAWDDIQDRFAGPVEVDETYMGGKEGNRRESKKLRAGRGAAGKTAAAGMRDRGSGDARPRQRGCATAAAGMRDRGAKRIAAEAVAATDKRTLQEFVYQRSDPDATVYTDEARACIGLRRRHETVKRSVGEHVRLSAHTNGIESFWSMLQRGFVGTCHKMSPKHPFRYVAEFAGRRNLRPLDTDTQMSAMAAGMSGKRLTYQDLINPPHTRQSAML